MRRLHLRVLKTLLWYRLEFYKGWLGKEWNGVEFFKQFDELMGKVDRLFEAARYAKLRTKPRKAKLKW